MFETLHNFEQMAVQFSPGVLISLGLAAVLVGLFFWLGGLGFRKLLLALAGIVSGAAVGALIFGSNIVLISAVAILSAFIAIITERIFSVVLAAALIIGFTLVILSKPYFRKSNVEVAKISQIAPASTITFSPSGSIEILKRYAVDFFDELKRACSQIRIHNWVTLGVLMLIFVVFAFLLWRLASAFSCAALGTMLIFTGMILLLIYKSTAPISHIHNNASFYLIVFLVMIGFGTFEQLLLCHRRSKRQPAKEKKQSKQDSPSQQKYKWRGD